MFPNKARCNVSCFCVADAGSTSLSYQYPAHPFSDTVVSYIVSYVRMLMSHALVAHCIHLPRQLAAVACGWLTNSSLHHIAKCGLD